MLAAAGVAHVAHGDAAAVTAGERAAADPQALALVGPFRSADVLFRGVELARRAAGLVVSALESGAASRREMLAALRALGGFYEHGDPLAPPVWLWRVRDGWELEPERAL